MSHYDDFEAAKVYNSKLETKYSKTVPTGNTSDLNKNTIDDALGFCNAGAREVLDSSYPVKTFSECMKEAKKDVTNKAEGARYCFLSSIASASHYAGCAEERVGEYLDRLVTHDFRMTTTTQHIFNMIITYCGIAMGSDEDLWEGVIAVRLQGVRSGKYSVNNHKLPMDKDLLLDAAARHLIKALYISPIDDESGESHYCHIVANILMFAAQLNLEYGYDYPEIDEEE